VTTPAPSGPSFLRVGGLAFIGIAVIAAVIGLATLANSGMPDTTRTAAPSAIPSDTAAPEAAPPLEVPPPTSAPATGSEVPVPSFSPPPAEGSAAPPPAPGGAPAPGAPGAAPAPGTAPGAPPAAAGSDGVASSGGAPAAARAPLRVYNNSRIEGLAAGAADDFRNAGWVVTDVGAYGEGIIPVTTVYYRPGTDEEAAANALGEQFGLRVMPRFEGLEDASPGVIVIVTREYADRQSK
jgi:hypothetical protein